MSVLSCIDLDFITDFTNLVTKPDKQMSSSITYNIGGRSTCQENVIFSIHLPYLLFGFLVFLSILLYFITFINCCILFIIGSSQGSMLTKDNEFCQFPKLCMLGNLISQSLSYCNYSGKTQKT